VAGVEEACDAGGGPLGVSKSMIQLTDTSRLHRVLCLGAHSDDIEIGCGATILRLARDNPNLEIRWVVFCGADEKRNREARDSAARYLAGLRSAQAEVFEFRDAFMPFEGVAVKERFESLKREFAPDLVFTHFRDDRHQDHRLLSDLAWNTWRDHQILEYEILKYDGDLGRPNVFAPVPEALCRRKIELLMAGFPTQTTRQWFTEDTFWAMLRIRGVECNSPTKFAEAFHCRKMLL
jgi:LmbE family N-acetylglucosaminyl deacetylase